MKLRNKKTGIVGEMVIMSNGEIGVSCLEATYGYNSLSEFLSGGWEDLTPAEPLIEDEKIRKVVRLCAGIWGTDKILVAKQGSVIEFSDGYVRYVTFMYAEWQDEIKDRTYYTIEELCGDEEAPEPIEPTFVDLDERVKEKGEE